MKESGMTKISCWALTGFCELAEEARKKGFWRLMSLPNVINLSLGAKMTVIPIIGKSRLS
jgi:hypothetical protein